MTKINHQIVMILRCHSLLSKILKVPQFVIRFFCRGSRGGCCVICNMYFYYIKGHLSRTHNLTEAQLDMYFELFPSSVYMMSDHVYQVGSLLGRMTSKGKLCRKRGKRTIAVPEAFSRETLRDSDRIICGECGKVLQAKDQKRHEKEHEMNQDVECFLCNKQIKKKNYKKHAEECRTLLYKMN